MIISIDKRLLDIRLWKTDKVFVYALSWCCVGISPTEIPEWKVHALHWEEMPMKEESKSIKIKFPEMLYNFYWLMQKNRKYSLSSSSKGKDVLMILENIPEPIYDQKRAVKKK